MVVVDACAALHTFAGIDSGLNGGVAIHRCAAKVVVTANKAGHSRSYACHNNGCFFAKFHYHQEVFWLIAFWLVSAG